MSKHTSEYLTLTKRSICWLLLIILVVGVTYYYQENSYKDIYNSITASMTTRELPIYSVQTDKKQVSLSFDAAWGNEDTKSLLETLKKYNVHATFFMTGGWVSQYPDDVKAIKDAGHDLGNHSEHHKQMSRLSSPEIFDEINQVTDKVQKLTGVKMQLFRPPYGDYDNHVIADAKECGYYSIQWSVDSLDWKNYGEQNIIDTILNSKDLKNGAIILMHNGAKYTAKALPKVIEGLKAKGYEIVPISQMIYKDGYHMDADGSQVSDKGSHETITQNITTMNKDKAN